MTPEMLGKLRAPFEDSQIGKLPRVTCKACSDRACSEHKPSQCRVCKGFLGKHIHLDYVGHAHVTERLLEIDPGWSWEPFALVERGLPALDASNGLWIRMTVGGKTVIGYGDAPGKRAAVKELIGDAIRNAAMRLGVALDLWKKEPADTVARAEPAPAEKRSLSPEERAAELRNLILAVGKKKRMRLADIAGAFHEWCRGEREFRTAPAEVLEEFQQHLQKIGSTDA
ncbi:hypothetical protein [Amycolatopsis rubida]|nr:hypothetical protein [Amycolatopsis rubida]